MIWKVVKTPNELNAQASGTLCDSLDIRFTEVGPDFLRASMPVDARTKQPAGLLHGGASVALAETIGSVASALCIEGSSKMPVGVEINANHIKAVTNGYVVGTVRPVRVGKTVHVWSIEIHDDKFNLICTSRLTVMIVDRKG